MRALVLSALMVFATASMADDAPKTHHHKHRHGHHHKHQVHHGQYYIGNYDGYEHGDPRYVDTSYAPKVDAQGWKHRFDGYYGDGFGNYWDLNCHQSHKNGHFFTKVHKRTYPDYQYPKFGYFGHHYHPFIIRNSHNISGHAPRGFYRCLNREGLSVECYKQHKGRG